MYTGFVQSSGTAKYNFVISVHVKIGNVQNDETTITYGVPQGTAMDPVLFILFINDLLKVNTPGITILYVGDTAARETTCFKKQNKP